MVGEITHNTKDLMDLIPDKLCQLCSELFFLLLALCTKAGLVILLIRSVLAP